MTRLMRFLNNPFLEGEQHNNLADDLSAAVCNVLHDVDSALHHQVFCIFGVPWLMAG